MAKKRRAVDEYKQTLNEADRYFIDNHDTMSVTTLSNKLRVSPEVVKEYVDSRKPQPAQSKVKLDGFVRKRGALAMTPEMSEKSDVPPKPSLNPSFIHRPLGE